LVTKLSQQDDFLLLEFVPYQNAQMAPCQVVPLQGGGTVVIRYLFQLVAIVTDLQCRDCDIACVHTEQSWPGTINSLWLVDEAPSPTRFRFERKRASRSERWRLRV
jgi:hypothetical protein